jgi:hypothetical protein
MNLLRCITIGSPIKLSCLTKQGPNKRLREYDVESATLRLAISKRIYRLNLIHYCLATSYGRLHEFWHSAFFDDY